MKCEKWTDQHDTGVGQRKNLSPRQESEFICDGHYAYKLN